jgi:hypothetical protein
MAKYRSEVEDLGADEHVRLALIAQGGWGKSVMAGTAPNALFLLTDPEGTMSAWRHGSTAKRIRCYDSKALENAQLDLINGMEDDFDWLIIDDATSVQNIFARTSMDNRVRRSAAKNKDNPPETKLDRDMRKIVALVEGEGNLNRYVPEQNDRYTYQNATIDFFKFCSQLEMNVIFICKRMSSSFTIDPDGNSDEYWTAAIEGRGGAVAELCLGYCNIVGSGETVERDGKVHRRLWFTHHKKHRGKDRTDTLGRVKDDLTIPQMMQIIEDGMAEGPLETDGEEVASAKARPRPRKRVTQ